MVIPFVFLASVGCGTGPDSTGAREPLAGDAGAASGGTSLETVQIGEILWYVDYDEAVEVARTEDKPLWVHFGEDPG